MTGDDLGDHDVGRDGHNDFDGDDHDDNEIVMMITIMEMNDSDHGGRSLGRVAWWTESPIGLHLRDSGAFFVFAFFTCRFRQPYDGK